MTNAISQVFKKSVESYYEDLKICQVLLSAVDVVERGGERETQSLGVINLSFSGKHGNQAFFENI